ncbi:hypothetical protein [Lentibacillus kimchii]
MKRESGNRVIKIITVISENRSQAEAMETSLAEKNLEALKELKKKLN